jgi:predicted metal-dependent hydrolase
LSDRPDFAALFERGIDYFNRLEFWEAHEAWEELWLVAGTDIEQYLQGLIQLTAAYHHMKRGTFRGGIRLFDASLRRLSAFPAGYCNLDRAAAEEAARDHRRWAATLVERGEDARLREDEYPKLRRVRDDAPLLPPKGDW